MELQRLLNGVEIKKILGDLNKEIRGIAYHSKKIGKNYLFTAIRGLEFDGHKFIDEAIKNGAEAVVLEEGKNIFGKTMILVLNSRKALSRISSNFYKEPSSHLKVIGITGTNGKTTTTYLLEAIFHKAGYNPGVIGTINYRCGGDIVSATNTTPESLDLQRILWEMRQKSVTHVVMEVSSHALDLDRVYDCQFDCAIFTNITQDHLDYHRTFQRYFESKKKLFSEILLKSNKKPKFAIINNDDPKSEEIIRGVNIPIIRFGVKRDCDITAKNIKTSLEDLSFIVRTPKGEFQVQSKLFGQFNIYNILAAVATGIAVDVPIDIINEGIKSLKKVPGRFERVENQMGVRIFVDYAHTPDALERALLALKEIYKESYNQNGKIINVFGCGGDRDRTKRPIMGEISGRLSDLTILTSDNPRTEDPISIINEIEEGIKYLSLKEWKMDEIHFWRAERGYIKIPDRRQAIRMAIKLAKPYRDTILIAGKGHEDYQVIGKNKIPFDDRVEAKKALEGG